MNTQGTKPNELKAMKCIRDWLVHHGRSPSVRELMSALEYKSPRSAALIIDELARKGFLKRRAGGQLQLLQNPEVDSFNARTVNVPLVGTVACGVPILAEENIEAMIPVSVSIARPGHRYFLLRASGDSMNEAGINDGDLVLVRQEFVADDGDLVVALIDDEATIKEFHRSHGTIILKPRSTNEKHKPIILADNFVVQGIVLTAIPDFE